MLYKQSTGHTVPCKQGLDCVRQQQAPRCATGQGCVCVCCHLAIGRLRNPHWHASPSQEDLAQDHGLPTFKD